jgi:cytochrome bd ubiquinol oxidase subunit I
MEYPFWHVPGLGATMLIPAVALVHVLVAHFAVGGGILLWLGIRRGYATEDREFLVYLRGLTRFFVLLTVVFGAITGVGIWWTIGLTSPDATSTLIHAFVFGWAAEWVTFLVEIVAAFGLFYFWDRFRPRTHQRVALVYAVSAWLSLVLITGITAFMLSSGRWPATLRFWDGFLNATFLPSVVARTGGALAITALYIFLHVTVTRPATALQDRVVAWASRWSLAGVMLISLGGAWWFAAVPHYVREKVLAAPVVLVLATVSVAVTALMTAGVAFGPRLRTQWLVPPLAGILFALGAAGLFSGEFLREAGRKPFTIHAYLYSSNIKVADVAAVRTAGYLNSARWPRAQLARRLPDLFGHTGDVDPAAAVALSDADRRLVGEAIYEHQCGVCHTRWGYNAVVPRLTGATRETVEFLVPRVNEIGHAMPPWAGQEWEARAVAAFLYHEARGGAQ